MKRLVGLTEAYYLRKGMKIKLKEGTIEGGRTVELTSDYKRDGVGYDCIFLDTNEAGFVCTLQVTKSEILEGEPYPEC